MWCPQQYYIYVEKLALHTDSRAEYEASLRCIGKRLSVLDTDYIRTCYYVMIACKLIQVR